MIAAIGTDGRRFVVWGLGETEELAEREAEEQETGSGDPPEIECFVEVDAARVARIEAGDVEAEDLVTGRSRNVRSQG